MSKAVADPGSFRDPRGRVFVKDGRIFRTIMPPARADYEFVRENAVIRGLIDAGKIVGFLEVAPAELEDQASNAACVVEHPRIPLISYPYEWTFSALKDAALLHLDIQVSALEDGLVLSDATAYNVQFDGPKPLFIDLLSFRQYRDGEMWVGHKQFCEQFLNPLLLQAKTGVLFNQWYRGSQEGIPAADLRRILPLRAKISSNVLLHVVAQAALQKSGAGEKASRESLSKTQFPKTSYLRMLRKLRSWIDTLQPAGIGKTVWQDYAANNSYDDEEAASKRRFVREFAAATKPGMLWDIGCNTGDYSKAALEGGAKRCIGFDFDAGALELAYARARAEGLEFLPLMLDGANPSPSQGWNQHERLGLAERACANAVVALAYIHHIAIARNVPLDEVVGWLISLAPQGIIEFVPKQDPMVQRLLRLREDIFSDYTEEYFLACIEKRARIVGREVVTHSGRMLVRFERPA